MTKGPVEGLAPTSLDDAIMNLEELQAALIREEVRLAARFLQHLVSHSAWLTDFDEVFESLDGNDPDVEGCLRWARWQLGNLRLELVVDHPDAQTSFRETKPYPNAVQEELVASSKRSTAENAAVRPSTGTHTSLAEDTENSIAESGLDAFKSLDDIEHLMDELTEP